MLTYDLSKHGKVSLYEYLYELIKSDILHGVLTEGEKLPSKRKLADHLSVSVITVQNAYELLLAEGYILSLEKRGYYIASVTASEKHRDACPQYSTEPQKKYPVDLVRGSSDPDAVAYSVWLKIMRRVIADCGRRMLEPMEFRGVFELRSAIAAFLSDYRGMHVDPAQIIIGAGTEYLYTLLIQLLGRDCCYGFEDPGYRKIRQILDINGVKNVPIPVDERGISVEVLQKTDVTVVHTSPAHHFPTGVTMPVPRRQSLLAWAYESPSRYILEDDYDSEFRFTGKPIRTLYDLDQREKVIFINTFSMTISPSLRISYMVLPPHLLDRFCKTMSFYSCTVSSLDQYTLAGFITSGAFERHINRCRKLYRQKRDEILSILTNCSFREQISIEEKDSGLHFLVRIKTQRCEDSLRSLCEACGIRVSFLSDYTAFLSSDGDIRAIVSYASVVPEQLKEALIILEKSLCGE